MQERSLQELSQDIRKFCEDREWDQFHDIKNLSIGIVTEASELLDLFRFRSPAESEALLQDSEKGEAVRDELADVFFFVLRLADKYKIDLSQALSAKMAKNAAKYPVELSRGNNRKYTDF